LTFYLLLRERTKGCSLTNTKFEGSGEAMLQSLCSSERMGGGLFRSSRPRDNAALGPPDSYGCKGPLLQIKGATGVGSKRGWSHKSPCSTGGLAPPRRREQGRGRAASLLAGGQRTSDLVAASTRRCGCMTVASTRCRRRSGDAAA
jgi:hypothetical protein